MGAPLELVAAVASLTTFILRKTKAAMEFKMVAGNGKVKSEFRFGTSHWDKVVMAVVVSSVQLVARSPANSKVHF